MQMIIILFSYILDKFFDSWFKVLIWRFVQKHFFHMRLMTKNALCIMSNVKRKPISGVTQTDFTATENA